MSEESATAAHFILLKKNVSGSHGVYLEGMRRMLLLSVSPIVGAAVAAVVAEEEEEEEEGEEEGRG